MTAVVTAVSMGLELLLGEGMVWAWWRGHPANLVLLQLLHTLRCAHTRACAPLPCAPQMAGRGASQPDVFFIAPKPGITKHLHLLPIRGETDCSFMDCVCLGVFLFVTLPPATNSHFQGDVTLGDTSLQPGDHSAGGTGCGIPSSVCTVPLSLH